MERRLSREQTIDLLERRARDMDVADFALSLRQLDRWFAGDIATLPRPSVCRVIEAEFRYPTEVLLAPNDGQPATVTTDNSHHGTDRQLRTVDFVSWIADRSERSFDDIYLAVAEIADQLAVETHVQRAASLHARAVIGRATIADAVQRYYRPSAADFYTVQIEDRPWTSLSILTRADWIGLAAPLDNSHGTFRLSHADDVESVHLNQTAVDAAIRRLASIEVSDTVLLDNPLFRLLDVDIASQHVSATLGMTTFAAYALTSDLLEAELIDSLVGGPDYQADLPLRDAYLPSAHSALSLGQRLCAGGPAALLAAARDDDYVFIVQERSPHVINVAGRLSVIPKAFHQPLTEPNETALSATIERELEEELLGRQDLEQLAAQTSRRAAPRHRLTISEPMRWMHDHPDCYQLSCTAFGINMLTGNYEFAALAVIDDPAWWNSYGHLIEANWEANRLRCYSSRDRDGLAELITDPNWSNEGLFAFIEGLRRLAHHNPIKTAVPDMNVLPQ
jgi:hypothetical protein